MRVRILQPIVSARWAFEPGQEIDLADAPPEARAWLSVPLADGTFRAEAIEQATVGPIETAIRRVTKRGRRAS